MTGTLTAEEQEILESYEKGEWESVLTDQTSKMYKLSARQTFRKDKRVNIRISGKDLNLLQARALREGIPYQTLMASVLHKYVNGDLLDTAVNMIRENPK
jgi:predicted DNA binding CopG/RHH family protein